jgi:hypothetical protein
MKFFLQTALSSGFFVLLSPAISAQSGPASVDVALQMKTGHAYKTGSPYCATKEYAISGDDGIHRGVNTANGAPKGRVCRDSLGRGRIELADHLVEIYDPVERVGYALDTAHRRASRTEIRQSSRELSTSLRRIWDLASGVASPGVESLGTDVIEGLVVEGVRSPNGLDFLAKGEEEIWFSRELGEVIVMKRSDGLVGSIVVYR